MFCCTKYNIQVQWPSVSMLRWRDYNNLVIQNIYYLISCCSDFNIQAIRWHLLTLFLQSIFRQFYLGKDTNPNPNMIDTRQRPNTLTMVANTEGSCDMVNLPTMIKQMTNKMAAMMIANIIMAFVFSAYLNLPSLVNSPESQYSCTMGSTSQQTKKFILQMMSQASLMPDISQELTDVSQMSMGRMRKHTNDRLKEMTTSARTQYGVDQSLKYHTSPMVNRNRHTPQIMYRIIIGFVS